MRLLSQLASVLQPLAYPYYLGVGSISGSLSKLPMPVVDSSKCGRRG